MLKLKEIRESRELSQVFMAKALNISTSGYSQLEKEKYKMNVDMLGKLADILECSTDEILGRAVHDILEINSKLYKKHQE